MDGAVCWCVCSVGYASEQKATQKSISKEEEAGLCTKKADFCSEAGPRTTFLHASAVHAGIQLLFAYQNTIEEGKNLILVGPCSKQHFLSS